MDLLNGVEVLCHSSIKIKRGITVYIGPFKSKENYNDADYIFCTHEHYDHFSPEDIAKVIKKDTIIVTVPKTLEEAFKLQPNKERIILVKPNETYEMENIKFETTVAYNKTKLFHQKVKQWVGYILTMDNIKYYIAGDTDDLDELENIKCDVAFVPIGGMYTMNYKAAANLINEMRPKIAVPTHYGTIIGTNEDAQEFKREVNKEIKVEILIK